MSVCVVTVRSKLRFSPPVMGTSPSGLVCDLLSPKAFCCRLLLPPCARDAPETLPPGLRDTCPLEAPIVKCPAHLRSSKLDNGPCQCLPGPKKHVKEWSKTFHRFACFEGPGSGDFLGLHGSFQESGAPNRIPHIRTSS